MLATAGLAGCHAVDFYDASLQQPVPPEMEPPRELSMVSLPAYRVEPPDILMIEMLQDGAACRRTASTSTTCCKSASSARCVDQPIDGFFLVEGEGIVTLGPGLRAGPRGGHDRRGGQRGHHRASSRRCSPSRRSRCSWPRPPAPRRSPASISSAPTARSTCGNTARCTWPARR